MKLLIKLQKINIRLLTAINENTMIFGDKKFGTLCIASRQRK